MQRFVLGCLPLLRQSKQAGNYDLQRATLIHWLTTHGHVLDLLAVNSKLETGLHCAINSNSPISFQVSMHPSQLPINICFGLISSLPHCFRLPRSQPTLLLSCVNLEGASSNYMPCTAAPAKHALRAESYEATYLNETVLFVSIEKLSVGLLCLRLC